MPWMMTSWPPPLALFKLYYSPSVYMRYFGALKRLDKTRSERERDIDIRIAIDP